VAIKAAFSYREACHDQLLNRVWLPNSPCIWGAGSKTGGLFACFVIGPEEDVLESHAEALKDVATVTKFGGGCGFTGTFIRPEGRTVYGSAHGKAYGPNRWAVNVSSYAKMISQGGVRNAALMYTLRSDHDDLPEFINLKQTADESFASNFNQSVMATDEWMNKAMLAGTMESQLLSRIAFNAWNNGEPGLLFYDTINKNTPYRESGQTIEATNPCGEQALPAFGSCNLGSINLSHENFISGAGNFSFDELEKTTRLMARFLDDVGTVNHFPNQKFANWYEANRPIGIGVMGFAGLLHQLGYPYGDPDSTKLIGLIMKQITDVAYDESVILGKEFGIPIKCEPLGRRNATVSSIAPTGSIAILADCEHSVEPPFSPMYTRIDQDGNTYEVEHPMANESFFMSTINSDTKKIPSPMQHLLIQAAAQKNTDAGVSKTINLPHSATPDQIRQIMITAWELGCKGITVYRDGSRQLQVLNDKKEQAPISEQALAFLDFDPSCINGICKV
jgi:ribonucleoside-diphosphate reductase alpha chain